MIVDIVCLILVGTSFYLGYTKGIIKTVFGVLAILFALLATLKFSFVMINLLEKILDTDPRINIILGFALTFILVMIAIRMIGHGLEKVLETIHLNILNKVAGGVVAGFMTLVVFSSLIWFLDQVRLIGPQTKEQSIAYPVLEKMPELSKEVFSGLKPYFSEFWDKTQRAMDQVDDKI
ncbi:MAG: CvpA family protein [Saprospiraceae bacterium]|nr:CvpA family protein [Saprospiraceae bacterium]